MSRSSLLLRGLTAVLVTAAMGACGAEDFGQPLPLDPTPAVTELTVTPATVTLPFLGATATLSAVLKNAKGAPVTPPRIYWAAIDTAIVQVDSAGRITGKALGTGRVYAQFLELSDTTEVTVKRVPVAMVIDTDTLLFTELGRKARIRATVWDGADTPIADAGVVWTSSAPTSVPVDSAGTITAVADGVATISATIDTLVRKATIRVASRPAALIVTPNSVSMDGISDTARVISVVRNAAGAPMYPLQPTYTSSDTTVATVDFVGFIIARKAGSATVTVRADTLTKTVPVTITQTIHSVRVVPDTATVSVGETKPYFALVKDRFGTAVAGATVTWGAADASVATIGVNGVVTGTGAGTTKIWATSGTLSDTAQVTVKPPA